MSTPSPVAVGIVLAAVGTIAWAGHYLFVRVAIASGSVTNAILVSMTCNLVLFVPFTVVTNYPNFGLTPKSTALFVVAGVAGGLFGQLLQFVSTDRVGASRTSPVVASAGLVSTLLAVTVLDESLTPLHFGGILLIVTGVMVTSWETARDSGDGASFRDVGSLLALPLLAAFFFGVEPILVKSGLAEGTPYLVGMTIMILSSFVGFFGYRVVFGSIPMRSVVSDPALPWYLGAGVTGGFAFVTYFAALDVAPVVVVIPIFDTVPLLVVAFSAVLMPRHLERVTWRIAAASVAVVAGATLVTLSA